MRIIDWSSDVCSSDLETRSLGKKRIEADGLPPHPRLDHSPAGFAAMSSPPAVPAALPAAFRRLAWSNLAAQSAEQVGLAAAPIVAVLALGAGAAESGRAHV